MAYSDLAALLAMVAAGVGDAVGPAMLRAVTTHRHPDHLGALAELVRRTGVRHTPGGIALALANAGQTHLLVGDPL
ncbi:MAG TPA: MBL fold metallo-hydrolase, partial [Demequina sp.]|nr:MBL fold metallo-hydrolase [Demequina sp.]